MALKTKTIVIDKGRDKGKKFILTEMPAAQIDNWAMRVILALIGAGVDIGSAQEGALGLARVAFSALGKIPVETSMPLLNELLDCVQIVPKGGEPRPIDLDLGDVEDFANLFVFRKEVFQLHLDFLQLALGLKSEEETGQA